MNIQEFDVAKFDAILERGLSRGLGDAGGQVCIEAAICETLGLGHSDDPKCVAKAVRSFKIRLNDAKWPSPSARALGLRDLGLAQLGSLGVVDDGEFVQLLARKLIKVLIPRLFREVFPNDARCLEAADRCERDGDAAAAAAAAAAASAAAYAAAAAATDATAAAAAAAYATAAAYADANAATDAAYAATAAAYAATAAATDAADAAYAAATDATAAATDATDAATAAAYLLLAADLALETLRELKSPGCDLLIDKGVV